jgi:hypothetical protein
VSEKIADRVPAERKFVTCGEALELSKEPGRRVFWRPDNAVNWLNPAADPAADPAEILEN